MKIVAPVDRAGEAAALLEAGADELYGGCVPAEWLERYTLLASINQRTFFEAQLADFDELATVVREARARGRSFSLTLNAPYYTDEQFPLLLEAADRAVEAGASGVILADLGLLRHLKRRHPKLELHASTLAHLTNSASVRFYAEQGADRVILPRHLRLDEMRDIVSREPQMRFDAFQLIGKCPNTEGLCTFHHSSADRIWPCEIPYRTAPLDGTASENLRCAMARQETWSRTDRRHGCGLCAIPALMAMGIYGCKLVGRGAPTSQKVKNIRLVRDFIDRARLGNGRDGYRQSAREAHRHRFGAPCNANICYYPELYDDE